MNNKLVFLLIILLLTVPFPGLAQRPGTGLGNFNGTISGRVHDATYQEPIEYANIVVYRVQDSTQVTGAITGPGGSFIVTNVPPGTYYLEVSFIGYTTKSVNTIRITPAEPDAHVGTIALKAIIIDVEGTEVTAERPLLTFEIDKKVINVSRQTTVTSGSAVDVLENVPSVNVDIEGNVSLRGSENFTVLIDGRPTILEPSDALRQIPATMIDNIEIITNPSAKYDPEGVSGIINVIMKKKLRYGISGIANTNTGTNNNYGGDVLISYYQGTSNFYIGGYYNHRERPGTRSGENIIYGDTTWHLLSEGESDGQHTPYGIRGGVDLSLTDRDKFSLGGRYGHMDMEHSDDLTYDEWTEPGGVHDVYTNDDNSTMDMSYYLGTLDITHTFSGRDHTLALRTYYSGHDRDHNSVNRLIDSSGTVLEGQQNVEAGPSWRARVKLDYKQPVTEKGSFESGYQSDFSSSQDSSSMYEYDTTSGTWEYMPEFSHSIRYSREIYAFYGIFSWSWGEFGIQTGLRTEYMNRLIEAVAEGERFEIERLDFFPSIHLSYKLSSGPQLMTSYTRRIQRPHGWWLEPFLTWSDAYNVHSGNPNLKPEYIDSYELGAQTFIGKSLLSGEFFYRMTHNRIERIQSVYSENVILSTVDNVGTGQMLGVEAMLDLKLTTWWNLNCTGNVFQNRIISTLSGDETTKDDVDWSVRFSNEFKPLKNTTLQINGRYHGPSITSQGDRAGFYTTDAALKQQFFNKSLSITLQARDIFGTGEREFTTETDEFYNHWVWSRTARTITLSVQYNFNNYKPERSTDPEPEFEGMEEL